MTEIESRIGQDAEGLQTQIEEQRQLIARLRAELAAAAQDVTQQAATELEQHAAERRRALQDVAERLRKRERDLQEIVEREGNDATQRIQLAFGDIERRQVEQLQRLVTRETTRYSEAASQQFDTAIRTAREEAARRLSRELDLAVERFAREAEGVLDGASQPRQRQRGEARRGPALAPTLRTRAPARRGAQVARGSRPPGRELRCASGSTRSPPTPSQNGRFSTLACRISRAGSTN